MLHDKILSAAAGGNTPDVAWGLPEWTGEFHSMGILEDLSDRYANWDDASVLSDAVMKGMSIGDEIIGVPYEMTVRAYLCHENIMKKGGASVPATWDDVLSMTDFKDKTGTYPYALACTGVRAPQEMIVYLAQKGLEICSLQDDGMYKNTWKDNADQLAAAADVFQFYKDCIDSGVVDPNSKSFGYEETDDNFVNDPNGGGVAALWDKVTTGTGRFFVAAKGCPIPTWLTIDLGVGAEGTVLSRIKTYPRSDYDVFQGGNIRQWEFWGIYDDPKEDLTKNPCAKTDPDYQQRHGFSRGWVMLTKGEQYKPSGYAPDGTVDGWTPEDREYYLYNTEYEVDNTNELTPNAYDKIRYLRLVVINTFATYQYPATSGAWFIGEITPWGQVNK